MQRGRWQLRHDKFSVISMNQLFARSVLPIQCRFLPRQRPRQWFETNLSQDCRNSSSRSPLAGEQSDTLGLLRLIDSKSRHRRIKSQRLHERVAATNHLSHWSRVGHLDLTAPQTSDQKYL